MRANRTCQKVRETPQAMVISDQKKNARCNDELTASAIRQPGDGQRGNRVEHRKDAVQPTDLGVIDAPSPPSWDRPRLPTTWRSMKATSAATTSTPTTSQA